VGDAVVEHAEFAEQVFPFDVPPVPQPVLLQPWLEQVVEGQAKLLQEQPPQFVGRPDARDKLLTVATAAE
jgi:hypothetical protein